MNKNIPVESTNAQTARTWMKSGSLWAVCCVLLFTHAGLIYAPNAYANEEQAGEERVIQTYGPVQRGETLWHISNRFHPDRSVSIYQTMLAIIEANPEAFPTESVHDLRVGHYIEIPTGNQIRAYDAEEARQKIVPQLGGEVALRERQERASVQESELETLRQQVDAAQDEAQSYARQNEALRERLSGLETLLTEIQSELEAASELEQDLTRALSEARQDREPAPTAPPAEWFMQWPGVVIPMLFLLLLLLAIWGFTRRPKQSKERVSPHKVAVAAHLQEQENETDIAQEAEAAEVESRAPSSEDEAFRDIDEILAEADADPDPDSDQDAGQTPEEAEAHRREQQAGQLDLARAYIEMEDYAEARAAIDEVLQDADSELAKEAQALLKKIEEKE